MPQPSGARAPASAYHARESVSAQTSIPQCQLGDDDFSAQLRRYRELSANVQSIERGPGHLAVRFTDSVPVELLNRTLQIERECCSFVDLDYDSANHELTVTVHAHEDEATLNPLVQALTPQAEVERGRAQ